MHEMSIALQIIEIAEKEARKDNAKKVKSLELEIGELSGVVIDALKFALDSAMKNTMLQNSSVQINSISGQCCCTVCQYEFASSELFTLCPGCGSPEVKMVRGREMRVKSLLVE